MSNKKSTRKKRFNVQTHDPEIQKKMLAYRDQLASGNDPIQEGAEAKERLLRHQNEQLVRATNGASLKPIPLNQKQRLAAERIKEAIEQVDHIHQKLKFHLTGKFEAKPEIVIREVVGQHQYADRMNDGVSRINNTHNAIMELLNENL